MKKNNIILFTWINSLFLKKELERWIDVFSSKHWEFNISRIESWNINKINFESELTTLPFLSENRLIILYGIPFSSVLKETENSEDDKILTLLEKIPDTNYVIFVQENPDKRKALYKKIIEIGTLKEFKNLEEFELKKYIREKLLQIDSDAIDKLIEYKNSDISKIDSEIDKLHLFKNKERIDIEDIKRFVNPEIEISIFQFLDRLFELNYDKALDNLVEILDNSKIEPTFAAIMTNIRKYLFTIYLHKSGIIDSVIIENLKLHPYVFQKIINNSKNYWTILYLYNSLILVDIKSKVWTLIWDNEESVKLAIEKEILDLKKNKKYLQ